MWISAVGVRVKGGGALGQGDGVCVCVFEVHRLPGFDGGRSYKVPGPGPWGQRTRAMLRELGASAPSMFRDQRSAHRPLPRPSRSSSAASQPQKSCYQRQTSFFLFLGSPASSLFSRSPSASHLLALTNCTTFNHCLKAMTGKLTPASTQGKDESILFALASSMAHALPGAGGNQVAGVEGG